MYNINSVLFFKIWINLFCIWLNFFSTLVIFPNIQIRITKSNPNFFIPNKYYVDIVVFLTFHVSVTLGNLLASPKYNRQSIIRFSVILRAILAFVFFAICNFNPDKRGYIPIWITNDYIYWIGCSVFPFFFGYLTSLLLINTPQ